MAAGGARAHPPALLAVLDVRGGGAVQLHHGLRVPDVRHAGGDLAARHLVVDLQRGQQHVAVGLRLGGDKEVGGGGVSAGAHSVVGWGVCSVVCSCVR